MDTLYRIIDAELAPDELAALTVVLMARAAIGDDRHPPRHRRRTRIHWRRLGPGGEYRSPVSWR
ncbi:hypothetical protein GCM10009682_60950 [Luedemannella flava]|uniref:Acyl-CoA carboxylase subunit epsilon n=1 Tax=Luedemannella flava TaxID=349316 RepID=A0ABN2MPQ1_9ACTN